MAKWLAMLKAGKYEPAILFPSLKKFVLVLSKEGDIVQKIKGISISLLDI